MNTKAEADWSEEEQKLVKDYEKRVRELQEEREKFRKVNFQNFECLLSNWLHMYGPPHEKTYFLSTENKGADQLHGTVIAKLISAFVFAPLIVQSLYFLNPKFEVSSHLLLLYSRICVGPCWKT